MNITANSEDGSMIKSWISIKDIKRMVKQVKPQRQSLEDSSFALDPTTTAVEEQAHKKLMNNLTQMGDAAANKARNKHNNLYALYRHKS